MRRALTIVVTGALTIGLVLGAAVALSPRSSPRAARERAAAPVPSAAADRLSTASLSAAIATLQSHLRVQPRDAAGWATLGVAYVEQARLSADPTYYPKAEGVLDRSLRLARNDNDAALAGLGALAAARHDFATALRLADRALAINPYGTRANAVRIDALVELGRYTDAMAAARRADATQPGIPIFTRVAYVFELQGRTADAARVLERAMASATDPGDIAYVATQLGELAWSGGDLTTAWRRFGAAGPRRPGLSASAGRPCPRAGRPRRPGRCHQGARVTGEPAATAGVPDSPRRAGRGPGAARQGARAVRRGGRLGQDRSGERRHHRSGDGTVQR